MLYIYYMKIIFYKGILSLICFFAAAFAAAQITVVRIDDKKVFLDTSSSERKFQLGDKFKIITDRQPLINPKTGKNLGDVFTYSSEGKLTEIQPLYVIGEMADKEKIEIGQEAVFTQESSAVSVTVQTQKNTRPEEKSSEKNLVRYEPVEQEIISVTEGKILPETHRSFITLSKNGKITVWETHQNTLLEKLSYELPQNKKPLYISAKDIKKTGLAQIFVTIYDEGRQKITTSVLENKENILLETETLPYFTKELGCSEDKEIWVQKPFVSASLPGNAYRLTHHKNSFVANNEKFSTQRNWLAGVNRQNMEKEESSNLIYTSANGKIRMILSNGKRAESKDLFASSPNRVKYKQDLIKFYPSLQILKKDGKAFIAAVENTAKLGLLSNTFGQYQNGKIHFLSFEKGRLHITDTVELDGFVYDTACTGTGLLTAEVLPDGHSTLVEILN